MLYGLAGSCAQVVMTNSTWTCNHIRRLWRLNAPGAIFVVFPPCDVESLKELPEGPRERVALSIGQFRPEKDHELQVCGFKSERCSPHLFRFFTDRGSRAQLRAFHELREMGDQFRDCRLVMAGGSRSPEDDARVAKYARMLRAGVPKAAVARAMRADGLDPAAVFTEGEEDARIERFRAVLRVGAPRAAVACRMRAAGLDPAVLEEAPPSGA